MVGCGLYGLEHTWNRGSSMHCAVAGVCYGVSRRLECFPRAMAPHTSVVDECSAMQRAERRTPLMPTTADATNMHETSHSRLHKASLTTRWFLSPTHARGTPSICTRGYSHSSAPLAYDPPLMVRPTSCCMGSPACRCNRHCTRHRTSYHRMRLPTTHP